MTGLTVIVGIDGTGKTSLAHALVQECVARGLPATYIYARTVPRISRAVMTIGRRLLLRGANPWKDYSAYVSRKVAPARHPGLAFVYVLSVVLDYYPQLWLKVWRARFTGGRVIADRYVHDTVVSDVAAHLNYSPATTARAVRFAMALAPEPETVLWLDAPEEVAFLRKDDVPDIEYLRERRRLYPAAVSAGAVRIDATRPASEVVGTAIAVILSRRMAS